MKVRTFTLALALGTAALVQPGMAQKPATIAKAIAASDRPATDKEVDAERKPAEMVAFAGIKPGDKVADLIPGKGYFTRVFAKVVGAKGHVYAVVPEAFVARNPKAADGVKAIAAEPGYKNVSADVVPLTSLPGAGTLDVAWTSQNYHDLYNNDQQAAAAFASSVFQALKPGGVFVVLDHSAAPGTDDATAKTLHRIDIEKVKQQVTAAGFKLEGESKALANPADARDKPVFDPSVRSHTDQFVLKFRKPA